MDLTTFAGNQPRLRETKIEKNYLNEKELKAMGNLCQDILILQKDKHSVNK